MGNVNKIDSEDTGIQGLLARYLNLRSSAGDRQSASGRHLDEDSLSAFAEGNLSSREAAPMISHMVDCSFCRHVTAELVRLDLAFAGDVEVRAVEASPEPTKISAVLNGILSRIFGTSDDAVFAHSDADEEDEEKAKDEEEKKD